MELQNNINDIHERLETDLEKMWNDQYILGRPLGWKAETINCGELVEVNGEYVPAGEA